MALINCKECGKEVSDKAESCVGCGAPITQLTTLDEGNIKEHKDDAFDIVSWHAKSLIYKFAAIVFMLIIAVWAWFLGMDTIKQMGGNGLDGWGGLLGRWAVFAGFYIVVSSIPRISRKRANLANKILSFIFLLFNVFMPLALWAIIAERGDILIISLLMYLVIWLAIDVILFLLI